MLPPESRIEVRSRQPPKTTSKPSLLFVHGGYCDAWCWEPYSLPWFASQGYPSYAVSLRGHGASGGRESLFVAGLDDYVADVEHVAGTLPAPPVLIGHSMGAAIIERMLTTRPIRAAALLAPIPPGGLGPVASRLLIWQPEYMVNMQRLDAPHLAGDILAALRPMYFSDNVEPAILAEAVAHLSGPASTASAQRPRPRPRARRPGPPRPHHCSFLAPRTIAYPIRPTSTRRHRSTASNRSLSMDSLTCSCSSAAG